MKSLLIVGGNSSISKAFVLEYSNTYGIDVIVHSGVSDEIKHLVRKIYYCDFSSGGSVDKLTIENRYDGIVFAQGVDIIKPFFMLTEKELIDSFRINALSTALIIKKLYKERSIFKEGSIVIMNSISGSIKATAGHFAYSVSKSSLNGLVKTLSIELARRGIRINSISSALVSNSKLEEVNRKMMSVKEYEEYQNTYPLGLVKMKTITRSINFLLSEDSTTISGSDILIDSAHTKL